MKGVVSYFLWRVIFRVLANRGRFCFVIRLTWGFLGCRCRLWHFWITLGTFCIRIYAQNGSILAQFLPKLKFPIYGRFCFEIRLFNCGDVDHDILISLWIRFVSVSVVSADLFWVYSFVIPTNIHFLLNNMGLKIAWYFFHLKIGYRYIGP